MSRNLEDIGQMAGVSRSTVSRVINNSPNVSETTRQKVLEIIQREGFSPNPAARTLVTQRNYVLGIVIPQSSSQVFTDPFFPTLIQGISAVAHNNDYSVMLWIGEGADEGERFCRRVSSSRLMDGLIIASAVVGDPLVGQLSRNEIPFVIVGRPRNEELNSVDGDNVHGAKVAVQHLIQLGYQYIAMITSQLDECAGQDRLDGYYQAFEAAGRSVDPDLVVEGNFAEASGYAGMTRLLRSNVDAVFCANDVMAVGAFRAITERGLSVPDDVAVVGFDDISIAAALNPPLTTIRQPIQQLGSLAAESLIKLLKGNLPTPYRAILPVELVIRESCGAVRGALRFET